MCNLATCPMPTIDRRHVEMTGRDPYTGEPVERIEPTAADYAEAARILDRDHYRRPVRRDV